jgi:hypothetical protein
VRPPRQSPAVTQARRSAFAGRAKTFTLARSTSGGATIRGSSGHAFVPEGIVRRRFQAGKANFEAIYKSHVNAWVLYDNSGARQHTGPGPGAPYPSPGTEARRGDRDRNHTALVQVQDGQVVRVHPELKSSGQPWQRWRRQAPRLVEASPAQRSLARRPGASIRALRGQPLRDLPGSGAGIVHGN